jgi:hypothetical protein
VKLALVTNATSPSATAVQLTNRRFADSPESDNQRPTQQDSELSLVERTDRTRTTARAAPRIEIGEHREGIDGPIGDDFAANTTTLRIVALLEPRQGFEQLFAVRCRDIVEAFS